MRITMAVALGLTMIPLAQAQTEIAPLVAQLGSRDYREREKANKALLALGPKSLSALKAELAKCDVPEVQRRLETLVERFAIEQLIAPSRVTVNANNQQIRLVLKDICKQAGYGLNESIGTELKVTLELKDVPFWEAVEKICAGSGISTTFQDDDRRTLNAHQSGSVSPHVDCAGTFRFTATNINTSRNVQLSNIPLRGNHRQSQNEYMNLNVQFAGEPKSPVVGVGTATLDKAVDEEGSSLVMPITEVNSLPEVRYYNNGMYRSLNQNFSVQLHRGDRRATTIKELSGKVNLLLLRDVRPEVEIEKVLEPGKKKMAGRTIEIELGELAQANGGYSAQITLHQRKPDPNDYSWWGNVYQRLELQDEKGNKYHPNGVQEQNVGTGNITMKIEFSVPEGKKLGKPHKLVLMEWITVEKAFAFSFKDVPLP